ncbi:M1 family metallopeptidase [Paenibacillus sediminis]|uniref:Peptidase M1 membrane alanine aminopeptidase domain-containing protein n=1 Tax=Paenibacillus sediminis TaxID=664909 RepID=A0ABS4H7T8_9BACL|nr:M1 family metallopeptidase [Paenibacillus sediminis]MBP1938599.1 hypothetical protein [Paenibacillus sediminis]
MTLKRSHIVIFTALALGVLVGTLWLAARSSSDSQSALAPEKGKPSAVKSTANKITMNKIPQTESVQQPQAQILSKRVAEYHIDVQLDPEDNELEAVQTITWTHPGKKTVNELYFHLYTNAFSSVDTTFMKESGGKLRNDSMPQDGFGSIELTELKTTDGISLMHRIQYVQPDDGNAKDKTLIKVRLPAPVKGGESITLRMKFKVHLPKVFARMGTAGSFVMAGQWFPKICVYEPAGQRGRTTEGWDLHQYHGNSEFYSDFGIYSVRISVPEGYTVAATGFPTRSSITSQGKKIYQFYADDVHDFAWAASPNFIYAEEPFSSPEVPGVRIKLYLDPAHKDLKERYFEAAKAALTNFSKWYGSYPYSTLSIVVPPKDGNGAGGMEYPTLITAFGAASDSPGYELERTVIHEIGHQYFYGMIANNEFEEAWLDEAFTSYAEDKLMEQEYGLIPNLVVQAGNITAPEKLTQEAWKFGSHKKYALNVYIRGKLVLLGIEKQVGTKTMNKIMSMYSKKYRFRHPTTRDFQRVVEQVTGKSWQDYFNQYVYSNKMADFSVDGITVNETKQDNQTIYESVVHISSQGGSYSKIPIIFNFEDGHTVRQVWNGDGGQIEYKLRATSPVTWAMIDPMYTVVLENNHMNNYFKEKLDNKSLMRWNLSVTKLIESLLGTLSW